MKTVVLIFTVDPWHTASSKELIGIASTKRANIGKIIKDYIKKHDLDDLSNDDWMNLDTINQTQHYTEGFEFMIEHVVMNELIEG